MNHMILTPNLQTTLFKQSSKHVYIFHYLFKSMGGTTKYENPGENTELVKVYIQHYHKVHVSIIKVMLEMC